MQRNVVETVLGAVVLAAAGGFLLFAAETTDLAPQDGYVVTAQFDKIDGLEIGNEVRISGVKVGKVIGFDLDPMTYLAIVKMNIRDGVEIPADTAAVIASDGLLGGKFMSLEPGGEEMMLKDGGEISYTQSTPSLETLLGQVIFNLNKGGGDSGDSGSASGTGGASFGAPSLSAPAPAPAPKKEKPQENADKESKATPPPAATKDETEKAETVSDTAEDVAETQTGSDTEAEAAAENEDSLSKIEPAAGDVEDTDDDASVIDADSDDVEPYDGDREY